MNTISTARQTSAKDSTRFDARSALILGTSALALLWPAAASAQDTAEPAAHSGFDTITVTARRTEENLQSTPIAVTALPAEALEDRQITNINAVQYNAPNVTIQPLVANSGVSLSIRGQAGVENSATSDPAVGIYVDGVYTARSSIGFMELVDVQQVEVLRGPQGTLFGRNTTGGALNITTPAPDGEFSGRLTGRLGNYDTAEALGYLNVPISGDEVAMRVSFLHGEHSGYGQSIPLNRELADADRNFLRGVLLIAPDDANWDLSLSADYFNRKGNGPVGAITAVRPGSLADIVFGFSNFIADDFYSSYTATETFENVTAQGASATFNIDLGFADLKSITAVRSTTNHILGDVDGSPVPLLNFEQTNEQTRQITQEFQLTGSSANFDWIAGAFYFSESNDDLTVSGTAYTRGEIDNDSIAIYAQGTYDLTDRLSITAGLRQTRDSRALLIDLRTPDGTICTLPYTDTPGVCAIDRSIDYDYLSYNAVLEFQAADNLFLYASTSRAQRAGGFNSRQVFDPFSPEQVTNYEAGAKWDLLDHRLRINLAAFTAQYDDGQRTVVTAIGGVPSPTTTNAAKATIPGFELEISALPTDNLEIGGSLGLLSPEYDEFNDPLQGDRSGESFTYTAEMTYNLYATYRQPLSFGELTWHVDYAYKDDIYYDVANPALDVQPGYGILNARLALELDAQDVTFALYGRNLGDTEYNAFILDIYGPFGYNLAYRGTPMTWGGEISYRF